jgi:ubiquitin carboxyl-terminal hydrolase 34
MHCSYSYGYFYANKTRTCLKDVPDHLIFHLKRFDFDLMTMERTKINDLFQFPEEIDVSAYHVDYLSDTSKARREDIFELVGILVHHGTSENGHYYSYIRERPAQVGSAPSWVEFNDREVDAFDPSQIPWQTFGGLQDLRDPHQQKAYSAYMVFYQRKQAIEQDQKEYIRPSQREPPKVPLPPGFYEEISADNDQVVHEYCLHDSEHSKFVRHLLASLRTINNGNCSDDHQQEGKGIRMALAHLCYIIAREREIEYFKEFFDQLRKSLLACVSCCQIGIEWLSTQQTALTITLLRCLHPDVRSEMRVLLVDCLHFLRKEEPTLYYGTDSDMDTATRTPTQGILADLVRQLKVVMHESWSSSRGWEDFHSTLCQIADMGHIEVALLLAHGFLDDALTIFGIHAHAGLRANHPDIWRIMEKKKLGLNSLAELVCLLTSHMDIRTIEDRSPQSYDRLQQYTRSHYTFPVTQSEFFLLCLWDEPNKALAALDKMIETYDFTRNDVFYPGEFLKWMLRTRDQRFQCMLFETVFEGITQLQHPFCDPYVRTAIPYCEACGNPTFASQVIDTALKKASVLRTVEDESWQALLGFVDALPTLESPALRLMGRLPAGFYRQILMRSRTYGPTLLLHDNRNARNATWRHLDRLFNLTERPEYISVETLTAKYTAVRYMLHELLERFRSEQRNRTLRSHLEPLIRTCDMLAGQLKLLYEEDDDTLIEFRHEGDERLLIQHFQEMVSLLTLLPDEESPSSSGDQLARRGSEASSTTAEPAELALDSWQASEFGSESEELDNLEPSVEPTSR